jgi:4-diphosphocytidyl-2-C-methyl-D-erythritol kinase
MEHSMNLPTKGLKILAPAKVNLTLEILGKRADGFHEIRTLIQPIGLFDTIWLEKNVKGLEIRCPGHPELENENNLALRAAALLEKELSRPLTFSIRLRKRIPIGGGLGGGSSNAAAVLSGLNHLLGDPVRPEQLRILAARLGSDIPFFLNKKTALATGRGERIEPWPSFPSWWYVLINPGFPISTAWAYGQVKFPLTENKKTINILRLKKTGEISDQNRLKNDLEPFVLPYFPLLGKIKEALSDSGCLQALMTGSGSTVFGIWTDKHQAVRAFKQLKQAGWGKVFIARGL